MSDGPLIKWIVEAFRNLRGPRHLAAVYEEVRRLGYDERQRPRRRRGGEDPNKLIRKRIYEHSSDSPQFIVGRDDLFHHIGDETSGMWELREDSADDLERLLDEEADEDGPGDDANYVSQEGDRRKLVERQIRERRGQQQFRDALRERYGNRCLVTGCEILAVLEAAHISPYRGESDNHPANGLLLRSDIHTLFDLDILGIEPEELRVELHPDVVKEYGSFSEVIIPCAQGQRPAQEALRSRYEQFRRRLPLRG